MEDEPKRKVGPDFWPKQVGGWGFIFTPAMPSRNSLLGMKTETLVLDEFSSKVLSSHSGAAAGSRAWMHGF